MLIAMLSGITDVHARSALASLSHRPHTEQHTSEGVGRYFIHFRSAVLRQLTAITDTSCACCKWYVRTLVRWLPRPSWRVFVRVCA